nr:MAG TPA: B-ZIP transcription factor [Caudoviricetes sp.]
MNQEVENLRAGSSAETSSTGLLPEGVYVLKGEEGQILDTMICQNDALYGDAQAAAVTRLGYKFQRPAEESDIVPFKSVESVNHTAAHIGEQDAELKGIAARLALLEQENAELKAKVEADDAKGTAEDAKPEGAENKEAK